MLSAELVRSVLESAPDAMIIVDASGSILFANRQVTPLLGYAPQDLLGRSIEILMPVRFRDRHLLHRHDYAENVRARPMGIGLELFALRQDGTEFPVEISLSPIRDRGEVLVAAAIRDVTDRMRVERELKEARAAADRANQAKSRFLATASHDLRQPLQSLALLNGTLRRLVSDGDALEALAQQELAIATMSRLLNALLDISKLEARAIKPEVVDFPLVTLFDELRAEFAGLATSKGLRLEIEPATETVRSDPWLVGQILRNLLANAIKYTPSGWVRLGSRRNSGAIRIDVHDSGIGIPNDKLDCIFDEFYQVGVGTNSSRDGYGLGLSIVQRLAKLLHLEVCVESQLGVGSTFSLTLPAGASALPPIAPASTTAAVPIPTSHPQQHVLLVEDDPGVRNATRVFLRVEGYRVTTAASVAEAVQRAQETPDIDVVVSDYHLGQGQTGMEAIAALRGILGSATKAVLVTGDTTPLVRALQTDARLRVTSKPINADDLLALLRDLLNS